MDTLNSFPLIKYVSLKYNAATPSSAPVERLFSLGKLVFTPKRNRLSDQKFEKLLLLRWVIPELEDIWRPTHEISNNP